MPTNDFKAFAIGGSANVLTQVQYEALAALGVGFATGLAPSAAFNKAWRQSSFIAAAIAQVISDLSATDVLDDGNLSVLVAKIKATISPTASIPYRTITHATTTPTITLSDGEIWCNTSGGDIIITAPLALVATGVVKQVPVIMTVGGGAVNLTTDGTLATRFGGLINANDDGGAGAGVIHLTASSAQFTGQP